MFCTIVAFPKIEDAKNIKNVLKRNGYGDILACNSASQVISNANDVDGGIVICGAKLPDMHYTELYRYLPREFTMILVASQGKIEECVTSDIICLGTPLRGSELTHAVEVATYDYYKARQPKKSVNRRSEQQKKIIADAKSLLMSVKGWTEEEAHQYMQKTSMDSGNNLVETAEKIMTLYQNE